MTVSATRRNTLKQLAALGALGPAGIAGLIQDALAAGDMPAVPGIHKLEGTATVNGIAAKVGTPVKGGDRIVTGKRSTAIVLVGGDVFLLRENTEILVKGASELLDAFALVSGKVLSVFSKRKSTKMRAETRTGTIGIRGTGMYLEDHGNRTYFCLCYGEAAIEGKGMETRVVKTEHHESPVWMDNSSGTLKVESGPFLDHTDDELTLLESVAGRKPPFAGQAYPKY